MRRLRTVCILACATALAAADQAGATLEELRAANQARSELARESAAWSQERQRIEALIAATQAETERLRRATATAAAERDADRAAWTALGGAGDVDALRSRLAAAGAAASARLRALAAKVPPGVVIAGEDAGFDAMVRVLEAAERAAATISVEVVTGIRDGHGEAVKLLRVAGAGAWWVSLDGRSAGSAQMRDGSLQLAASPASEAAAIRSAVAQAEGRAQPAVEVLP